ncbi:MAG: hypothetical protein AAGG75_05170 [Bacteroidota bacterium]
MTKKTIAFVCRGIAGQTIFPNPTSTYQSIAQNVANNLRGLSLGKLPATFDIYDAGIDNRGPESFERTIQINMLNAALGGWTGRWSWVQSYNQKRNGYVWLAKTSEDKEVNLAQQKVITTAALAWMNSNTGQLLSASAEPTKPSLPGDWPTSWTTNGWLPSDWFSRIRTGIFRMGPAVSSDYLRGMKMPKGFSPDNYEVTLVILSHPTLVLNAAAHSFGYWEIADSEGNAYTGAQAWMPFAFDTVSNLRKEEYGVALHELIHCFGKSAHDYDPNNNYPGYDLMKQGFNGVSLPVWGRIQTKWLGAGTITTNKSKVADIGTATTNYTNDGTSTRTPDGIYLLDHQDGSYSELYNGKWIQYTPENKTVGSDGPVVYESNTATAPLQLSDTFGAPVMVDANVVQVRAISASTNFNAQQEVLYLQSQAYPPAGLPNFDPNDLFHASKASGSSSWNRTQLMSGVMNAGVARDTENRLNVFAKVNMADGSGNRGITLLRGEGTEPTSWETLNTYSFTTLQSSAAVGNQDALGTPVTIKGAGAFYGECFANSTYVLFSIDGTGETVEDLIRYDGQADDGTVSGDGSGHLQVFIVSDGNIHFLSGGKTVALSPAGPTKVSQLYAFPGDDQVHICCIANGVVQLGQGSGRTFTWGTAGTSALNADVVTGAMDADGSIYLFAIQNSSGVFGNIQGKLYHARLSSSGEWSAWEQLVEGTEFIDVSLSHDEKGLINLYTIDSKNNLWLSTQNATAGKAKAALEETAEG